VKTLHVHLILHQMYYFICSFQNIYCSVL